MRFPGRRFLVGRGAALLNPPGGIRRYLTARGGPHFLIIGAQRCGTTALFGGLCHHPAVVPPLQKEIHFFDLYRARGLRWYRSFFPQRLPAGAVTGEATPEYLFYPACAREVRRSFPEAKIIVSLRDPVERAFSQYWHHVKKKGERLSFEEALQVEEERLPGELVALGEDSTRYSHILWNYSLLRRGHYAQQLQTWLTYFPKDQIHVVRAEDLWSGSTDAVEGVLAFLGLSTTPPAGAGPTHAFTAGEMKPDVRRRLEEYFAPYNRELERLLGREMGWSS
jgi:Sulfotransferase domain